MKPDKFKELLDELNGNSLETLKEKNARYAKDGDCLHNFRSGAEVAGGTPAQACWGYMTKHLVALRDMVERDDFSNREDFLEKCQDTINYIRFLWCIGNDGNTKDFANLELEIDDKVWCFKPLFASKDAAEDFIRKMEETRKHNGGILPIVNVYNYMGLNHEQSDYLIGWSSVCGWAINPIDDYYRVLMPKPVNI